MTCSTLMCLELMNATVVTDSKLNYCGSDFFRHTLYSVIEIRK